MSEALDSAEALFAAGKLMEAQAAFWALARTNPRQPKFWARLGDIAFKLSQFSQAFDFYGNAYDFDSANPDINLRLGQCLERLGDPKRALGHLLMAAAKNPASSATHACIAACREATGDADGAIDALRNYLAVEEHDSQSMLKLADMLMKKLRFEEAGEYLKFAALLEPDNPLPLVMQGNVSLARQETAKAHGLYLKALEIDQDFAPAWFNLGNMAMGRDDFAQARDLFAKAWALAPNDARLANNLAVANKELGDFEEAEEVLRQALAVDPGFADAHWNLATALFLQDRWREGFEEAEWRWEMAGFTTPKRDFGCPAWDGGPLDGKTMLVHAEQGLGDAFHFARYLPLLAPKAKRLVCEVDPKQASLFARSFPMIDIVSRGQALPPADVHLPLMSAPRFLGFPAWNGPYLSADSQRIGFWRKKLAGINGGRWIGFAWQGNPGHHADRRRSPGLAALLPMLDVPGLHFASLQHGAGREQLFKLTDHPLDLGDESQAEIGADFEATAAMIMAMDAVVAPDTAIAHLAAAMGKPVFLLLPFIPDWRWGMTKARTPWYPALELFRQAAPGDWSAPVSAVIERLKGLDV